MMQKVEKAVIAAGGKGRMGTCSYCLPWTSVCALVEYGKRIVDCKAKLGSSKDLLECFNSYTPGAKWFIRPYIELANGVKIKNICSYTKIHTFWPRYMKLTEVKVLRSTKC